MIVRTLTLIVFAVLALTLPTKFAQAQQFDSPQTAPRQIDAHPLDVQYGEGQFADLPQLVAPLHVPDQPAPRQLNTRLNLQKLDIFPEQRSIRVRSPESLSPARIPHAPIPFTVAEATDEREQQPISLDEAIRVAIQNAEVIRVLGGVTASSSGRTIYDVAISNAAIESQYSVFDPTFEFSSTHSKTDRPGATFDPFDPTRSFFVGSSTDSLSTTAGLSKRMFGGGTAGLNANTVSSYFEPGVAPLEPEYRSFLEASFRQPLMRGYGRDANLAPVLIARIDTERSYFRFKDSAQELVRGVIAAYWNLVSARVGVWAREQQIAQAEFAYDRAINRQEVGLDRAADVAQAKSALANFRAGLITARSTLILNETALRNILGLPPSNTTVLVPTSMPVLEQIEFDWNEMITLAEQYRPDIIELKLILEADRHSLVQVDNQARPQLDGIANYRWDGLSGEMPGGATLPNDTGRFQGFNIGVNFSVPLGLRQSRAALRRQELLLASDQANLEQGVHQMVHQLTVNYRNLDQFFQQYEAFKQVREASRINFENQISEVLSGRREFINVLQAITDWGNAVSQEASSITQYNTELANVERQTGTILETHGIRFIEERYGSVGPQNLLGIRRTDQACYPSATSLDGGIDRYPESQDSSDEAFNLEDLDREREEDRAQDEIDRRDRDERPDVDFPSLQQQNDFPSGLPDDDSNSSGRLDRNSESPRTARRPLRDLFRRR